MIRLYTEGRLARKLHITHLAAAVVSVLTLVATTAVTAPLLHSRFMNGASNPAHTMTFTDARAIFVQALAYSMVVAGAAAIVAATGVSLWISRRISKPIRSMAEASKRVASGDYDEHVEAEGQDEVAALAHSFNTMAGSLLDIERTRRQLIGDVSHEIRTPLASLRGYLEGLRDGVIPPESTTFELLITETDRLSKLVEDMQELSTVESEGLRMADMPVPVAEIINSVAAAMQPVVSYKGVGLTIHDHTQSAICLVDPSRMKQVLINLLGNAVRYTPTGGSVTVTSRLEAGDIVVRVADTGIGLSELDLSWVFERFYRVDKSRARTDGGTGVGLSICRALVKAMGGRIWAESGGPGKGSTFTFTIPTAPRADRTSRVESGKPRIRLRTSQGG